MPRQRGQSPQIRRTVYFMPYAPAAPCPCGSGRAFGECCQPFGENQHFVRDPDGGYAKAIIYSEQWNGLPFADIRSRLMETPAFWCTEDTLFRCFWHYRPGTGRSQETFGTLELTADALTLETLSKNRATAIHAQLEQILGKLPAGVRRVKALAPHLDGWEMPVPATADSAGVPILEEYAALRERSRALNHLATKDLSRDEMGEAARRLRLLDPAGRMVFDNEHDVAVLSDFCLYEEKRHGQPVYTCFLRKDPPMDPQGATVQQAVESSWVGLIRVERITPEGLVVRDLLEPNRPPVVLVDLGLIQSARPGVAILGRLMPTPRFAMLAGWGYVVQPGQVEQVLQDCQRMVQSESRRGRVSALIRYCRNSLDPLFMSERTL